QSAFPTPPAETRSSRLLRRFPLLTEPRLDLSAMVLSLRYLIRTPSRFTPQRQPSDGVAYPRDCPPTRHWSRAWQSPSPLVDHSSNAKPQPVARSTVAAPH